jgi:hypothetical protein
MEENDPECNGFQIAKVAWLKQQDKPLGHIVISRESVVLAAHRWQVVGGMGREDFGRGGEVCGVGNSRRHRGKDLPSLFSSSRRMVTILLNSPFSFQMPMPVKR